MTFTGQVLLTPAAEASRIETWLYVAKDSPEAADRLLERIDEKSRLYATQPEMGTLCPDPGSQVPCFPAVKAVNTFRQRRRFLRKPSCRGPTS